MRSQAKTGAPMLAATLEALESAGHAVHCKPTQRVYAPGDEAASVMFLRRGRVSLTVRLPNGSEALVTRVKAGEFFGEGCLGDQRVRLSFATATTASTVLVVEKASMKRLLRKEPILTAGVIARILTRNLRMEQDLYRHVIDSTERRLARALLRLAGYGTDDARSRPLPWHTHESLAGIAGLSRAKVDELMQTFRRRGFITQTDTIRIHPSLMQVLLQD